jgi:hypothetical protein
MTISCAIDGDGAAWWWTSSMRLFIYDGYLNSVMDLPIKGQRATHVKN